MCLITTTECKIAKNDLYTIKVLSIYNNNLLSPYQSSEYKLGKIKSAGVISKKHKIGVKLERGLHSFYKIPKCWFSDNFLHNQVLVLCQIPKESTYYLGHDGDIISNKLIPLEIVNTKSKYVNICSGRSSKKAFNNAFTILEQKYGKQNY